MAINGSVQQKTVSVAEAQLARVAGDGCARHSHLTSLLEAAGPHSGRDLADAVHLLCNLHGHYPGLIEVALQRCPKGAMHDWLSRASDAFERERLYLVRLTAAVGPLPSTPGAAETAASLVAARHALETLATSEREGCALGAATALIGDWWPIRRLLDRVAARGTDRSSGAIASRRSLGGRDYRACSAETPGALGHSRSAASSCCFSTGPCSICSRPGPRHAATIKPLSRIPAVR